jgi:solute carrier family 25 phosphate transporter 23/24/25/41
VYRRADANNDGRLTSEELRRAVIASGFKISSRELREVLRDADYDHDGVINFDEFRCFLLLLPAVNPDAVWESFGAATLVDHAQAECTPPPEIDLDRPRADLLAVLVAKLYSGSLAGGLSRTLTAPIDRLKMVMQAAPPGSAASSGGMAAAARTIHAEGGLAAFFRGNGANVLKIAPETSIKFVCFDALKAALAHDPANVTAGERFVAGGGAGALAQATIYPLEICKTRLAVSTPGTCAQRESNSQSPGPARPACWSAGD